MAIVKQLLTIQNLHEKGGGDAFLVNWQGFFGTVGQTKSITQPIVLVSIFINAALISGLDHHSEQKTFDPDTYRRWPPGYYVLLVLAPLHFILSVMSFVAFLRIDVITLVEIERRKAQREAAKKTIDDLDTFEAITSNGIEAAMSGLSAVAAGLQYTVDRVLPLGMSKYVPIERVFILRNSFDFWWAIVNIFMSICGTLVTPLCFSFHMLRIAQLPELQIVIRSITTNSSRLVTTCLFAVVAIYLFAIVGLEVDFQYTSEMDNGDHGPWWELLYCSRRKFSVKPILTTCVFARRVCAAVTSSRALCRFNVSAIAQLYHAAPRKVFDVLRCLGRCGIFSRRARGLFRAHNIS